MADLSAIRNFLNQKHIAIAGVSRNKTKFGNSVFKELKKKDYSVYPVNPNIEEFEGEPCYNGPEELPSEVTAIVVCTNPAVTPSLVEKARAKGIRHIWLQQGSASKNFLSELGEQKDIISRQCIFMFAEPVTGPHKFHRFISKLFGMYPREL